MSSAAEPDAIPYRSPSQAEAVDQQASPPQEPKSSSAPAPTESSEVSSAQPPPAAAEQPTQAQEPEHAKYKIPHATHQNAYKDDTSMTQPNSMEHTMGQGQQQSNDQPKAYSGANTVPNLSSYERDRQRRQQLVDEQQAQREQDSQQQARQPTKQEQNEEQQREKQEMMKRLAPGKKDKPNKLDPKGSRTATDPVTKMPVQITDADLLEDMNQGGRSQGTVSAESLDPRSPQPGPELSAVGKDGYQAIKYPAPEPAKPGNILLQPFPAPENLKQIDTTTAHLDQLTAVVAVGLLIVWYFVAFGDGAGSFFSRTFVLTAFGFAVWSANHFAKRKIEKGIDSIRLEMHKQRGEEYSPPTPESVEWLNGLLLVVWKLIDPKLFASSVDMVEDIMQQSLPGFIDSVKISDYGQGDNPLRIVAMRALPDQPHEKEYPREEWINQGMDPEEGADGEDKDAKNRDKLTKTRDEEDLDEGGDYVNYEVTVAYAARPGQAVRQHNLHLLLEFFLGLYDWTHIPIKIWAQVEGFSATARLRIQFVPQAPFVRNLTFTLMGVPSVNVSVQPLIKHFPNVLDLPLISGFVKSSIAAAASEYVAPKSMTLNMAQMLAGGGVKKDTNAVGVIAVTIHHAQGLSSQDSNGKSDPYIVLAYAKFGKPMYSSRIITEELNPVWEETAFVLLSADEVKSGEDLAVTLWDSDQRSADDLLGRVTIPVTDLMLKPNQVQTRTDQLRGFQDADELLGELTWSVAFYDKAPFDPSQKRPKNSNLPKEIRDRPELQDHAETAADTTAESSALSIPPSPEYPSGIVSVILHNINNLENKNLKGTSGKHRELQTGQKVQSADQAPESEEPSAYAEILLNDELMYKTRVKQFTSMPIFEAGMERFVRDWRTAVVRIVVRDSRLREYDPILGVATLKLSDILVNSSQVTNLYSLQDGVGFGRVNVALLFRSVEAKLDRSFLGWSTATCEIASDVRFEPEPDFSEGLGSKKLEIMTSLDSHVISSRHATQDGQNIVWQLNEQHIRLPIYMRYATSLVFTVGPSTSVMGIGGKPDAVGSLMFQDLVDDEEQEVRVPVVVGKDLKTVRQNALTEQTAKTHDYKVIGHLVLTVIMDAGLDPDHAKYATNQTARHEYETYEHTEGLAERSREIAEQRGEDGKLSAHDKEKKKKLEKDELKAAHHGPFQFTPYRTGVWAKGGVKRRMRSLSEKITGDKPRQKNVESEA